MRLTWVNKSAIILLILLIIGLVFIPTAAAADGDEIGVAVGDTQHQSNDTITIWISSVNSTHAPPVGIPDEEISVSVRHDSTREIIFDKNVTTNESGIATVTLDLAKYSDGEYGISVAGTDGSDYTDFVAGNVTTGVNWPNPAFINQETNFGIYSRNGPTPTSGAEHQVSVEGPNGTLKEVNISTDSDGFTTVTFTPSSAGRYSLKRADGEHLESVSAAPYVAQLIPQYDVRTQPAGKVVELGGFLHNSSGLVPNQDFQIKIYDDENDTVVKTINTSTNSVGLFTFQWKAPDTVDDYDLKAEFSSGEMVLVESDYFDLAELDAPSQSDGSTINLDVSIESTNGIVQPGSNATITIEATDDQQAITNQPLTASIVFESYSPNIPFKTIDLTTNNEGKATQEITIPKSAPTGIDLSASAGMEYNGKIYEGSHWGIDIQRYRFDGIYASDLTSGETNTLTITATDGGGEPVSDAPIAVAAQYGELFEVVDTGSARTNDSGVANLNLELPSDIGTTPSFDGPEVFLNDIHRYQPDNYYSSPPLSDRSNGKATLNLSQNVLSPGETFSAEFETGSSGTSGLVVLHSHDGFARYVMGKENTSHQLTIPEGVVNDYYDVQVMAVDDTGAIYTGQSSVQIDRSGNVVTFDTTPLTPQVGENVTFDASGTEIDGTISTYMWDFGDGTQENTTSAKISHTYSLGGTYGVNLTVTNKTGSSYATTQNITIGEEEPEDPLLSVNLTANKYTLTTGETVTLNATTTGDPAWFEWDIDNDGTVDNTTNISTLPAQMAGFEPGEHTSKVTVFDGNGSTASAIVNLTVLAENRTLVVDADGAVGNYTAIQNAVNNATDGDIVEVRPGTYKEEVVIDANITLVAPDGATLDGSTLSSEPKGITIQPFTESIVEGFEIKNYYQGIGASNSAGEWVVRNSVLENNSNSGVSAYNTSGNWTILNSTIADSHGRSGHGINAGSSSGNWQILNTTVTNSSTEGIEAEGSTGDWLILNSLIEESDNNGVSPKYAEGNWTIRLTSISDSDVGVHAESSKGNWTIHSVRISNYSDSGVNARSSTGDWSLAETLIVDGLATGLNAQSSEGNWSVDTAKIKNVSGFGIRAGQSTGNWVVQSITINQVSKSGDHWLKSDGTGVYSGGAQGQWNIRDSKITETATDNLNATGAYLQGDARYNYWGASDGPSGNFNGSGGSVVGNVTVEPYYTDSDLTTLSNTSSNLIIESAEYPDVVEQNETLVTSAVVTNDGGTEATTDVGLNVSGETVNKTTITLAPSASKEVILTYEHNFPDSAKFDAYLFTGDDEDFPERIWVYDADRVVEPDSGNVLWSFGEDKPNAYQEEGELLSKDGKLYTVLPDEAYENFTIIALDADTGETVWERQHQEWTRPVGFDNEVLIFEKGETLIGYNSTDGKALWSVEKEHLYTLSPEDRETELKYGEIYAESNGNLIGIDAATGDETLNVSNISPDKIHRSYNTVYAIENHDGIYAISPNGDVKWRGSINDYARGIHIDGEGHLAIETSSNVTTFETGSIGTNESRERWNVSETDFGEDYTLRDVAPLEDGYLLALDLPGVDRSTLVRLHQNGTSSNLQNVSGSYVNFYEGETGLYIADKEFSRIDRSTGELLWNVNESVQTWLLNEERGYLASVRYDKDPVETAVVYDAVTGEEYEIYGSPKWIAGNTLVKDVAYVTDSEDGATRAIQIPEIHTTDIEFEIGNVTIDRSTARETISVSSTITNTGDQTTVRNVELDITKENGDTTYLDSKAVTLNHTESAILTFADIPSSFDTINHTFTVSTDTWSKSTQGGDGDGGVVTFDTDPQSPFVGENVTFNASASKVAGSISTFEWNLGDGTNLTTKSPVVNHSYNVAGTYEVNLTIINETGATYSTTQPVTVENESQPQNFSIESIRGPDRVTAGEQFSVSVTLANPDLVSQTESIVFSVDTDGDGTFEEIESRNVTVSGGESSTIGFVGAPSLQTGTITYAVQTNEDYSEGQFEAVETEYKTAVSTGDPHLVTFDDVAYDFQAAGEYVLVREPKGNLEIQARQGPIAGSNSVTINTALATTLENHRISIDVTDATPVKVDGSTVQVNESETIAIGNGTLSRTGNSYTVTYPGVNNEANSDDDYLTADLYNNRLDIEVGLHSDRVHTVEGLFGSIDGNSSNDISLDNGGPLSHSPSAEILYGAFRDDWRVTNSTSLFTYESGNGPQTYYDPLIPRSVVTLDDLDPAERSEAEQLAQEAGLEPGTEAYRNAIIDYVLTGDDSYFASASDQNRSTGVNETVSPEEYPPELNGTTNLSVTATDDSGSTVSDVQIILYNNTYHALASKRTGAAGNVSWSTLVTGEYNLEVYGPEGSFWGGETVTVDADGESRTIQREAPRLSNIELSGDETDDGGYYGGRPVNIGPVVENDGPEWSVRVRIAVDTDNDNTAEQSVVRGGLGTTIATGDQGYYGYEHAPETNGTKQVRVVTESYINNNWVMTGDSGWDESFNIKHNIVGFKPNGTGGGEYMNMTIGAFDETYSYDTSSLPGDANESDLDLPNTSYSKKNTSSFTKSYPWSAVGNVSTLFSAGLAGECSGTLIDDNHVITAGHCVYNNNRSNFAESVKFTPGANNTTTPFGQVDVHGQINVKFIQTYQRWVQNKNRTSDIAVLTLEESISSETGTFDYKAHSENSPVYGSPWNPQNKEPAHLTGYPAKKADYLERQNDQWDIIVHGEGTDVDKDDFGCEATSLCHDYASGGPLSESTVGGQSGAPVWQNHSGKPTIISIHSGSGGVFNIPTLSDGIGVRITNKKQNDITQMINHGYDQINETDPMSGLDLPDSPDDDTIGSATGDPHFTTYDGITYDFQAAGEFVLTRSSDDTPHVQARFEPTSNRDVSVVTGVATQVGDQNITIDARDSEKLTVNETTQSLNIGESLSVGTGKIVRTSEQYIIIYPGPDGEVNDGDSRLEVTVLDDRLDVFVNPDRSTVDSMTGLLGNPDGDATNDITFGNGTPLSRPLTFDQLYGQYRDDYRVTAEMSLFNYDNNNGPDTYYDQNYPSQLVTVEDLNADQRKAAVRAAQNAGLEPGTPAFRNAVIDYALTDDPTYIESAKHSDAETEVSTDEAPSQVALTPPALTVEANDNVTQDQPLNASIRADHPNPATVTMYISNGTNIIYEQNVSDAYASDQTVIWDSKVNGDFVENGTYRVAVVATTEDGVQNTSVFAINVTNTNPIQIEQVCDAPGCGLPTDPDGDGVYEDIDGNGRFGFHDVGVFFEQFDADEIQEHPTAYDFNGNDRIDFNDIVTLFEEI